MTWKSSGYAQSANKVLTSSLQQNVNKVCQVLNCLRLCSKIKQSVNKVWMPKVKVCWVFEMHTKFNISSTDAKLSLRIYKQSLDLNSV